MDNGESIYRLEKRLKNAYDNIEDLENEENVQFIKKFMKKQMARGLSKPRLIKYASNIRRIAQRIDTDLADITEETVTNFLIDLENRGYGEWTKKDYKVVLKKFLIFVGKEELAEDIRTTVKQNKKKLPEGILTKKEVKEMIETAENYRNKTIIAVLYESGMRIGELLSMKIKNVEFDKHGAILRVRGKTGERRIRIVSSASLLSKWLEVHPRKDERDAPLWVSTSPRYKGKHLKYHAVYRMIKRIAKRGNIEKNVYPHIFRHSRATHLAKELKEAEMNEYFGWIPSSDMPSTYVHLSGRDVDDKILEMHGLKEEDNGEEELTAKKCPRCKYINGPTDRFCSRCGAVLDEEKAVKLEMQGEQLEKDFPDLALKDPQLLSEMKQFTKMVKLFERKPELFQKMQAILGEEE